MLVERATLCDVTHAERHMIKQVRGRTWHQSSIPHRAKARSHAPACCHSTTCRGAATHVAAAGRLA
jgi:hypothetical protein